MCAPGVSKWHEVPTLQALTLSLVGKSKTHELVGYDGGLRDIAVQRKVRSMNHWSKEEFVKK